MTPCCAGPLGAVKLLLLPSWFTAEPKMQATTVEDVQSCVSCSMAEAHASPLTYPSAALSRVLQRPSGASMPARLNMAEVEGVKISFTPATGAWVTNMQSVTECDRSSTDDRELRSLCLIAVKYM